MAASLLRPFAPLQSCDFAFKPIYQPGRYSRLRVVRSRDLVTSCPRFTASRPGAFGLSGYHMPLNRLDTNIPSECRYLPIG